MNLLALTGPLVATVNPTVQVSLRLSSGVSGISGAGVRTPQYRTPVAFTASISSDGTMTVTAVSAGALAVGQSVAGQGVAPGTTIQALGTGTGGVGTYVVQAGQAVASESMTADLLLRAQVQALSYKDLMQLDGINLGGEARAIYLAANAQGVVRPTQRGGDLIVFPDTSEWLTVQALETWAPWSKVAAVRQS